MSYSLLYSLPQALRYSNVPVSVEAGNLLRETETGRMAAQLRLKNGTGVPVTGAVVGVTLLGAGGERLGGFSYSYSAYAAPGAEFGQAELISLRDCPAVAFTVEFLRVSFADGHVWTPSGQPVPIPAAPQQPERRGKRCVFPLIFAVAAHLFFFGVLCWRYFSFFQDYYDFSYYLGRTFGTTRILFLLVYLAFPVLCFALTPKAKAACKPLGIVSLILGSLQILSGVLYLAFLLLNFPATTCSLFAVLPGSSAVISFYSLLAGGINIYYLLSLLAEGCLIAASFITGVAFLKAARR